MTLTNKQASIIDEIIGEKIKETLDARRRHSKAIHASRLNEGELAFNGTIDDIAHEIAIALVQAFRQKIVPCVVDQLNNMGLSDEIVDRRVLDDVEEYFDPDGSEHLAKECAADIVNLLVEYANDMSELAFQMITWEPDRPESR